MIPCEFLYENMQDDLDQMEVNPRAAKFESIGFESVWVIFNLGSFFLFIAIFPIRLIILPCMSPLSRCCPRMNQTRLSYIQSIWNWPIRMMRESYIIIVMGSLLNISFVKWANSEDNPQARLNLIVAWTLCAVVALYPAIQAACLYRQRHRLSERSFRFRFGSAYEGLRETDGHYMTYSLFFFYRRSMIITCLLYFNSMIITQFFIVTMTGLATMILLTNTQPFRSRSRNRAEILEEVVIMVTMYHIFCFTDFIPDAVTKHYIGYSLIVCMLGHLLTYLLCLAYLKCKEWKRALKMRYLKRQAKKELKKAIRPGKTLALRRQKWVVEKLYDDSKKASRDINYILMEPEN